MVWQKNYQANQNQETPDRYGSDTDFGELDFGNFNVDIKPDYYIHYAILKAQNCLSKDNANEGFLQYLFFIGLIENLCIAAKKIDEDYLKNIEEYSKQVELDDKTGHPLAKEVKIANYKLRLMMTAIWEDRVNKTPLKTE